MDALLRGYAIKMIGLGYHGTCSLGFLLSCLGDPSLQEARFFIMLKDLISPPFPPPFKGEGVFREIVGIFGLPGLGGGWRRSLVRSP